MNSCLLPESIVQLEPSGQPTAAPSLVPSVNGAAARSHWLDTMQRMFLAEVISQEELDTLRRWIEEGVEIELESQPKPRRYDNTLAVHQHHNEVKQRLEEYHMFGAVEKLPLGEANPPFIQPLHAITKPNSKTRIVLDLARNLNDHVVKREFHYASVEEAVQSAFQGCYLGKLDLSNCFLSFGMDQDALKFLVFKFQGLLQRFVRLPFGLTSAPLQCTRLLTVPSFAMRELGLTTISYLDDFIFIAATAEELTAALDSATQIFQSMGLVVNPSKREGPAQRIVFLGVEIDSVNCTLACPRSRIDELLSLLSATRAQRWIPHKEAQSLIGKLSFAATVLPGFRPFMRRLHDAVKDKPTSRRSKRNIRLNEDKMCNWTADCDFWIRNLTAWNGAAKWRSAYNQPVVFATDASTKGFGFYVESIPSQLHAQAASWAQQFQLGSGFAGIFDAAHADLHSTNKEIAWTELFAILAALITYGPLISNQSVLFRCDNESDCHIINRQSTQSPHLAQILRRIYAESIRWNLSLRARHRSGVDNTLADFLSRPLVKGKLNTIGTMKEDNGAARVAAWQRQQAADNSLTHSVPLLFCSMLNSNRFEPRSEVV